MPWVHDPTAGTLAWTPEHCIAQPQDGNIVLNAILGTKNLAAAQGKSLASWHQCLLDQLLGPGTWTLGGPAIKDHSTLAVELFSQ